MDIAIYIIFRRFIMSGKLIILVVIIVLAILGASLFLIATNPWDNNNNNIINNDSNQSNGNNGTKINNNTNNTNGSDDNNSKISVTAVVSGPSSAKEGDQIQITWKVTNNGNVPVTNVQASSQIETFAFDTINPGQTKEHTFNHQIPTSGQVEEDFNTTLPNPYVVGGFGLSYSANGQKYSTNSNSLSINLIY
jgi:capsular polysaccharide biosynthesis protein